MLSGFRRKRLICLVAGLAMLVGVIRPPIRTSRVAAATSRRARGSSQARAAEFPSAQSHSMAAVPTRGDRVRALPSESVHLVTKHAGETGPLFVPPLSPVLLPTAHTLPPVSGLSARPLRC